MEFEITTHHILGISSGFKTIYQRSSIEVALKSNRAKLSACFFASQHRIEMFVSCFRLCRISYISLVISHWVISSHYRIVMFLSGYKFIFRRNGSGGGQNGKYAIFGRFTLPCSSGCKGAVTGLSFYPII